MKKVFYMLSCCAVAGLLVCALPQTAAKAANRDTDAATAEENIRKELIEKETKAIRDINPASTTEKVTSETADGPPYMTGDDKTLMEKAEDKAKEEIANPPAAADVKKDEN